VCGRVGTTTTIHNIIMLYSTTSQICSFLLLRLDCCCNMVLASYLLATSTFLFHFSVNIHYYINWIMNNEHIFFWRQNDASLVYSSHTTSIVELKVVTPPCDVVVASSSTSTSTTTSWRSYYFQISSILYWWCGNYILLEIMHHFVFNMCSLFIVHYPIDIIIYWYKNGKGK